MAPRSDVEGERAEQKMKWNEINNKIINKEWRENEIILGDKPLKIAKVRYYYSFNKGRS